ncbi:neuronal acetylcholine receptor subunit alpha-7 [Biomphalaria pfeifferi]|uniref:Neuronal acetylcholine receptor subunit alpha-7 n=1 Tax=Biomphalaria pfeifferi TaxID=112525 RepID=A0AAD8AUH7_BIOPF|nr:neuronal acetylcholine receptor subunit alpha-7 [Biomphalaria pfeifferi]
MFSLLIVLWSAIMPSQAFGGVDVYYRLHQDLFADYNPEVRPSFNYTIPTEVIATLSVAYLTELDIKHHFLHLCGFVSMIWTDEKLTWNPEKYDNINQIYVKQERVWKPDMAVYNSVADKVYLGEENLIVTVSSNGTVRWEPLVNMGVTCKVDISNYPFDVSVCGINLTSWIYPESCVELKAGKTSLELFRVLSHSQYYIEYPEPQLTRSHYNGAVYRFLNFPIKLTRRPEYLILTVMVPITMLAVMCAVPFLLSPEEPEKLMVSITLLLSFAVSIDYISEKLPQTSINLSVLVVYLSSLFVLSFLGVLANAVVLFLKTWDDTQETSGSPSSNLKQETNCAPTLDKPASRAQRLNKVFMILNIILLVAVSGVAWILLIY